MHDPEPQPVRRRAYRVRDAAADLGIGERLAWSLIRRGELVAIRIGGRTVVPGVELDRFIAERMEAAS